MKDMIKYINERCNNKHIKQNLEDVLKHDILWNANKCLKFGLVHKII